MLCGEGGGLGGGVAGNECAAVFVCFVLFYGREGVRKDFVSMVMAAKLLAPFASFHSSLSWSNQSIK